MRRTTICRSSRATLFALVTVPLACSLLRAQDTTRVQDTTQAAPATDQVPGTHTVAQGETLWSIATLYFGDPLLWPEIYRLNTNVVEDPHWIYPGEVLVLGGLLSVAQAPGDTNALVLQPGPEAADTVRAVQADTVAPSDTMPVVEEPPPVPVGDAYETMFDRRPTRREVVRDVLRAYTDQPYRPLRRGEFYAAGFLTERERLPWAEVLGATATPAIHRLSERTTAVQFEEIAIEPPKNASYHVDDSVLVVRRDRDIPGWGDVVVPLGIARVSEVQRSQILAQVVTQFGRIRDGQFALPLEPFKDPGQVRPTPVQQGLVGQVIAARDVHTIAGAQQIFFIDRGRVDGIVPGDMFEVFRPASGQPVSASEESKAVLMVVHTRDHSASGLVVNITHPDVQPGAPVRLIKKMPS